MKIVHLAWGLTLGGLETMLVNIANEQSKTEQVTIIIINEYYNGNLLKSISENVKVILLHRKLHTRSLLPVVRLYYEILKINPDIIHVHAETMGTLMRPFMNKVAYTIHDTTIDADKMKVFRHCYAISNSVKKDFESRTGHKATVVYNGVEVDDIQKKPVVAFHSPVKVVQLSRLMHEKKGQHILIEAVDILRAKGLDNIEVDFIGTGNSEQYLKSIDCKKNLESRIHFLGAKPYSFVEQHLCDYDLLVQPSIFEGFGLTVPEAMAAKIPVLVSDVEGPMEIIDNGRYGYFFKSGDASDCAHMIEKIIRTDNAETVEKAYRHVLENFNISVTAKRYISEYHKILNY